ncbi:hypothetical protein [Tellurirhabdus bombi]|uniref:hypothetical protein n=1 Tax=Tellurirhabdus bombi TaxID=2907205 RepID=UPI001F264C7B|nr:hypothetical protein [Tellurirhabdus bombi]
MIKQGKSATDSYERLSSARLIELHSAHQAGERARKLKADLDQAEAIRQGRESM